MVSYVTTRKTVYRVGARSGEVRELPATSGPGVSLDLFGVYVGGVFETQEAAVRFAEQYCREQVEKLAKQAESHRDWLARNEPQQFQIGDKVAYVGNPPFSSYVRGLIREVVAVRRDAGEGFKYQVAFPRHETTWIPQRDLSLRERGEAGKKRDQEQQDKTASPATPAPKTAVFTATIGEEKTEGKAPLRGRLLGRMARPVFALLSNQDEPFRRVVEVREQYGCEPTYRLDGRDQFFEARRLEVQ